MSGKNVEFYGHVGQVILGNLIHGKKKNEEECDEPCDQMCPACKKLKASNKRLWVAIILICVVMVVALSLLTWKVAHSSVSDDNEAVCYFNGVSHSIGATVKMPDGEFKKCCKHADSKYAEWGSTVNIIF